MHFSAPYGRAAGALAVRALFLRCLDSTVDHSFVCWETRCVSIPPLPFHPSCVVLVDIASLFDGSVCSVYSLVQIFLAQTRTARVGMKLARNLAAEVPIVTHLFMGLLQAPQQVCVCWPMP